ncbi:MAG: hypothetical protein A4E29_01045 [Methanomassiliicoccales archaeon PtaB.Bin134]|nr:MAG: hypothetical protein A4E29_01045 [Methanomassiliicoccales archaeon PtaB.Bin134]
MPSRRNQLAHVCPPMPVMVGVFPSTRRTALLSALAPSPSSRDAFPAGSTRTASTVMVAPVLCSKILATSWAASTHSWMSYSGSRRISKKVTSSPGMVLTFSTLASRLVGSKVERSGSKSGFLEGNLPRSCSDRKTSSSEPTRRALMPFSGVEACTCLPLTTTLSQMMDFSAISITEPSAAPASGTYMMSSVPNSPSLMRCLMPWSDPASSSATTATPNPTSGSSPVSRRERHAKMDDMIACPLSSEPLPYSFPSTTVPSKGG